MNQKNTVVVILAAGRGTRMKSDLPKVLHSVGGKGLVDHVVSQANQLNPQDICVVLPQNAEPIQEALRGWPKLKWAIQKNQLGTGDAVKAALPQFKKAAWVLVLNGDMPLLTFDSLKKIMSMAQKEKADVLLTTLLTQKSSDFGRIVRNEMGEILKIVEFKDASPKEKLINEVNVGVYAFSAEFLKINLKKLSTQNVQKEYYLTDLISLAKKQNKKVSSYALSDPSEALGVNSQLDLNKVNAAFSESQRRKFMDLGVRMVGQHQIIESEVVIEAGVTLEPNVILKGKTFVAKNSYLEAGVVVNQSFIGQNVKIKAYSYLDEAKIENGCSVGPFAHLRPLTYLKQGVKVGNFVEIKKSTLGPGTKANHLSYLGDATLGSNVNIGAGTITCNYDGHHKYQTVLEDGVFVGSDTQLVAPVRVGKEALIAAGSTITKNVSAHALVLSRVAQTEIPNGSRLHRAKVMQKHKTK